MQNKELTLCNSNRDIYEGVIETFHYNGIYSISIIRDGIQIYSLTTPTTTGEYTPFNVKLKIGDVIKGEGNAQGLAVYVPSNIEFTEEISTNSYYGDYISKLTVLTVQNNFYFRLTGYMPGMEGGSA